jgi:molecular chaperone DnaK
MLQEMGDKIAASDKTAVQNAVDGLKKAIADNDVPGMTRAMDLLTQMQHKAAEALYKNAGPQGSEGSAGTGGSEGPGSAGPAGSAGSQGSGSQGSQGDVIDAEVVDDK